jgi:hypothetical protein
MNNVNHVLLQAAAGVPPGHELAWQMSLYLDSPLADAAWLPAILKPTADFKVTILNQKTPGQGDYSKGVARQHQQWTAGDGGVLAGAAAAQGSACRAALRPPEQECTRACCSGSRKSSYAGAALHVCNQL